MNQPDLVIRGFELMWVGMSVVFVFLILLVGLTSLLSKIIQKFTPIEEEKATEPANTPIAPPSLIQILATTAIHKYRQQQNS